MTPDELFPLESVTMDSPRVAWMKRHGVTAWATPNFNGDTESPETGEDIRAWNAARLGRAPGMLQGPIGTGATEDDALAMLADKLGLRLWNEEKINQPKIQP